MSPYDAPEGTLARLARLGISRDLALRVFFAAYFFLCTLLAVLPTDQATALWPGLRWIATDLEGTLAGIETHRLWVDLHSLRLFPFSPVLLLLAGGVALALVRNRQPCAAATGLLLVSQLLGYSTPGNSLAFQLISYAATGYFLGRVVAPPMIRRLGGPAWDPDHLAWLSAVSALGAAYASAALSKWMVPGFRWADPLRMAVLLHYGKFRFEMGATPFAPPAVLLDWFPGPSLAGEALLWSSMLLEAGALFLACTGRYVRAFLAALLLLHAGIVLTLGIAWPPLIVLLGVLAFPWERSGSRVAPPAGRVPPATVLTLSFLLAATAWCLPKSGAATTVFPFNRFAMYTFPSQPLHLYYFRLQPEGQLLPRRLLRDWAHLSPLQLNLLAAQRFPPNAPPFAVAQLLCAQISGRLHREATEAWTRWIHLDEASGRVVAEDSRALECRQVPGE